MFTFLTQRFIASAIMIFVAGTIVFFIVHLLPGDPVDLLLGEHSAADAEVVEKIRKQLRLDLPLPVQYYEWVKNIVHLDLGMSFQTGLPVSEELGGRILRSLELIFWGLVIATLVGIPTGIVGARHPDTPIGWLASALAVLGFSSPVFVTGILLILVFSLSFGLLPASGYVPLSEDVIGHFQYILLPSLTLGFGFMGVVIRITRASVLEVLSKDYIRTAHAKGLSETSVMYRHALVNSLIPVITVIGIRAGNLLGGTVIVESLFNWPGLSSLLVRSCYDRDYPVIQGALISIFIIFVCISLCVDVCHGLIDPQIRHQQVTRS